MAPHSLLSRFRAMLRSSIGFQTGSNRRWIRSRNNRFLQVLIIVQLFCLFNGCQNTFSAQITHIEVSNTGFSRAIAAGPNGEFMAVWQRGTPSALNPLPFHTPFRQWGRIFHSDGTPKTEEFEINSGSIGSNMVVKADADGNYTCFWSVSSFFGLPSIYMRQFDSTGRASSGREKVIRLMNEHDKKNLLITFDADMAPDGHFIVVWSEGLPNLHDSKSILYAQRFYPNGDKKGHVLRINPSAPKNHESQSMVSVSMDEKGGFAVAWLHRTFPPFPGIERHIALKIASFNDQGYLEKSRVVMEEKIEGLDEHTPPVIKKTEHSGLIVLTTHTEKRIGSEVHYAKIEGMYYPDDKSSPQPISIPIKLPEKSTRGFGLATTEDSRFAIVMNGLVSDQDIPHFIEYHGDFSNQPNIQILNEDPDPTIEPTFSNQIAAREDGSYVFVATRNPKGFPSTAAWKVEAGIIKPSSNVPTEPISTNITWNDSGKLDIRFETKANQTYQLLRGAHPHTMEESELIEGTGTTMTITISPDLKTEFFAIKGQ